MEKISWYEKLFENYAEKYENECFTKGTLGECNFLEQEFGFDKSKKIIDIGCGTGRHTIELTKRGYDVLGIDLSENMLKKAHEKADNIGVNIKVMQLDARNLSFNKEFDYAIMLCEGSFPLMETDEENFKILQGISFSLKDKAKLIFTTLNGLFPVFNSINDFFNENKVEQNAQYNSTGFNIMTFRDHNITTIIDDDNNERSIECNERYYIPSEITWLLKTVGFDKVDIFGAKLGNFSRNDLLTTKDYEMLIIAEK